MLVNELLNICNPRMDRHGRGAHVRIAEPLARAALAQIVTPAWSDAPVTAHEEAPESLRIHNEHPMRVCSGNSKTALASGRASHPGQERSDLLPALVRPGDRCPVVDATRFAGEPYPITN